MCGDSYKDNYQTVRITEKVSEVVILQKYLTKKYNLTDEQFFAADLNNDGTVNVFDVIILKRRILKG
ncbi:MAG: dockerin type I repeat-containing protein [Ruminococcus flavefaciens]|nr:dockerin type I repeat-containing protein [Ruminococcus flavefaciens]